MSILLIDDHPFFIKGLQGLLSERLPNETIFEAGKVEDAKKYLLEKDIHLVFIDINLPDGSGLDILEWMNQRNYRAKRVILTMHRDEFLMNMALDAQVDAYLLKDSSEQDLEGCLKALETDSRYVSQGLNEFLMNRSRFKQLLDQHREGLAKLTQSELKTLQLVAQGKTSKEISSLLFISEKSVDNYRSRICKKLNLEGRNALTNWTTDNHDLIEYFSEHAA